jgi:ribonuclease-3
VSERSAFEPDLDGLSARLGYTFTNRALLRRAMAHRSWCSEVGGEPSNERLEFLGDAVLGWVVADIVYRRHTDLPEGKLTDLRKSVVNAKALAEVAASIDLGTRLLLGRGEDQAGGRHKASILSDALEAVLGAVYLDGGVEEARDLVEAQGSPEWGPPDRRSGRLSSGGGSPGSGGSASGWRAGR